MIECFRVGLKREVWAADSDMKIIKTCEITESMHLPRKMIKNKRR